MNSPNFTTADTSAAPSEIAARLGQIQQLLVRLGYEPASKEQILRNAYEMGGSLHGIVNALDQLRAELDVQLEALAL